MSKVVVKVNLSKALRSIAAFALGLGFAVSASGTASAEEIQPPTIIPREVWGAREPRCEWAGQDGNRVTHVVIHHSYEPTDPPSLESAYAAIRHIQNLHMDDNGWCDVGYSYLVDWFGNVYEGTKGAAQRPITSAHTAGMNYEGVGIVMIGNYMEETPSAQTVAAAGRVAGWVLGWYGFDAEQDVNLRVAGGNNKWANGTNITVPAITGHRDLVNTECPGDVGYTMLPYIRTEAATISAAMHASGAFGAATTPIFGEGEPSVPLGNNAQDTQVVADEDHLAIAEPADDAGDHVSETAPATEPGADNAVDEVVETAPPAHRGGANAAWWVALPLAAILAGWFILRQRNSLSGSRRFRQPDDVQLG